MKTRPARHLLSRRRYSLLAAVVAACLVPAAFAPAQRRHVVEIRGHQESLYVYGSPRGDPVILSSGDGGWIHLARHVAEFLGARGFFVVGFDVKAYLSDFTTRQATLQPEQEPGDYRVLIAFAARETGKRAILLGVSEGAGLSVLAATDPATKAGIAGVIGLGLPDLNELGWRWRDMLIYLTHRPADEPTFSTAAIVGRVAPIPLAVIHSSRDEFVPAAEVERVLQGAGHPKRLWIVEASDHRFSNNLDGLDQRVLEAIEWIREHRPR